MWWFCIPKFFIKARSWNNPFCFKKISFVLYFITHLKHYFLTQFIILHLWNKIFASVIIPYIIQRFGRCPKRPAEKPSKHGTFTQCCFNVEEGVPTLKQLWVNVPCWLGGHAATTHTINLTLTQHWASLDDIHPPSLSMTGVDLLASIKTIQAQFKTLDWMSQTQCVFDVRPVL